MIVPMPPRRPVVIPPGLARVLLAAAAPMLVVALTMAWIRSGDAVAQPAAWPVVVMLALVVVWLAVAAFGGRARR